MRRIVVLLGAASVLAGCGSHRAQAPPEPRLPRALAHSWSRQADAVAAALGAKNACGAEQRAERLLGEVVSAINAGRIPQALLEQLTSAANALLAQITCPSSKQADAQANASAETGARNLAAWLLRYSR